MIRISSLPLLRPVALMTLCLTVRVAAQEVPPKAVDFARQILPILSEKCFVCHGPDAQDPELLRLDTREGALEDLGGYRAIDPKHPQASRVLARIHDAKDPMPPAAAGKPLSREERDLLSRWVLAGGTYAKHWAFVPPIRTLPRATSSMTGNPIDAFVTEKLSDHGVGLADEADRSVLARRAALVLTGLPPAPPALSRVLSDTKPESYERFVDELLASPSYGEHQARYWLDAVRYGDTHGLHLDNRRGIYPYRDWVVRAFNDNLALDEFITWQLAGDLLPKPTLAQKIATGFVRMNPSTAEGGAIPAEFQAKNSFDRTETFGTVMLGMTLTCARCHTHKYDPIAQTEYYRLLAFFNNTAEASMDGNRYAYAPVVEAPATQEAWDRFETLQAEMPTVADRAEPLSAPLLAHATATAGWTSSEWHASGPFARDAVEPEDSDLDPISGLPGVLDKLTLNEDQALLITGTVTTRLQQSLHLIVSGDERSEVWLDGELIPADASQRSGDDRPRRLLLLSQGPHTLRVKLRGGKPASRASLQFENPWEPLIRCRAWSACSSLERIHMLADPNGPVSVRPGQERAARLARRATELAKRFTTTLVARELPTPRETRVLMRGEYDLPTGEPLVPGTPAVMNPFPRDEPKNRLGLARWLTAKDNPLVARVLVNRIWQRVFGYGIVRTPEDFGLQGQQPSHQELLDWLAVELVDSGFDMKHLLRLMLTSKTFRQRSAWRSDIDDPENRWLARGPRFRLDAEVIRDFGLFASGLLDQRQGGEGIKPYQPDGLWAALAHPASNTKKYVPDTPDRTYRRSLYVYWKRTSPHPMMILFDAPSRESSCVIRSRTNTPLQSLALLNETQRLEMARAFAGRLLRSSPSDVARMDLLFTLVASRPPTSNERRACETLLTTLLARYKVAPDDSREFLAGAGVREGDRTFDANEVAAWTQVVITVLASDVALMLY